MEETVACKLKSAPSVSQEGYVYCKSIHIIILTVSSGAGGIEAEACKEREFLVRDAAHVASAADLKEMGQTLARQQASSGRRWSFKT